MEVHSDERNYMCTLCGVQLKSKTSLRFHQAVHITERNFMCDECGKRFKTRIQLNKHHREVGTRDALRTIMMGITVSDRLNVTQPPE